MLQTNRIAAYDKTYLNRLRFHYSKCCYEGLESPEIRRLVLQTAAVHSGIIMHPTLDVDGLKLAMCIAENLKCLRCHMISLYMHIILELIIGH